MNKMLTIFAALILLTGIGFGQQSNTPPANLWAFTQTSPIAGYPLNQGGFTPPGPYTLQLPPTDPNLVLQMNGHQAQYFEVYMVIDDPTPGFANFPGLGIIDLDYVNNTPIRVMSGFTPFNGVPGAYGGFGMGFPYNGATDMFSVTVQGFITNPNSPTGWTASGAINIRLNM